MIDITDDLQAEVTRSGLDAGFCHVFVPHTTCAVTVNEGADPHVQADFLHHMDQLAPREGAFQHAEGNSDSHIKAILVGTDITLVVEQGRIRLGRWQAVFLCEFDGPRRRTVWVSLR
jgi:secondary thiamine-phosphate synthase enzyme